MSIWQDKCVLDYHIQQQIKLDALEELYQEYKKYERRVSKQNQKYEQRKKYKNKKKKSSSSSSSNSSSSSSSSTSSNFQKITSSSESDSLPSLPSNSKQNKKHEKFQTKILDFVFDINPPRRDYLIEYELNGQKKMTSMKNLNEKIYKLNNQSKQIQNDDEKNEPIDDNLKQDLKDQLELGVNRYYQQNPFEYCFRCKQSGHQERQCTEQQTIQCNYCLSQKHIGDICSNVSCFRCNQMGHRKNDCRTQLQLQQCLNCGKNSHKESECGILTQQIHKLKDQIECLACRLYGHINCQNNII